MLLRDELKLAFETRDSTRIVPEILPPEMNIHIPLINYISLAYTPYDLANELFQYVEELWTKHLRILSQEAQDYQAKHGFYPWEEKNAAGLGDAAVAPGPAPNEPLPQAPLQAGESAMKAQALPAPAAGEVSASQAVAAPETLAPIATPPPALQLPAHPDEAEYSGAPETDYLVDDGYPAWTSYYPKDAKAFLPPEEGPVIEAWGEGILLGWQAFGKAFHGPSDLFQKLLDDVLRQGYPSWETLKEINDAKIAFAHNLLTIDVVIEKAIDSYKEGFHTADKLELSGRNYEATRLRVKLAAEIVLTVASIFGGALWGKNALSSTGCLEAGVTARGAGTAERAAAAANEVRAAEKTVAAVNEVKAIETTKTPPLTNKFSITTIEREGSTTLLELSGENGTIHIAADMTRVGDRLILDRMDIEGAGAGSSSISELRNIARAIGKENGAREVVIRGERRNTGMGPGHYPREIIIKVY